MPYRLFTLIGEAVRVAMYSLIFGPALAMYVFVMLATSQGSLSQQFLTTFHDLTDGVPAGKVMACVNENVMAGSFSPPQPGESLKPVPPALEKAPPEVLCQRGWVDSDSWARSVDATLRNFWLMAVIFGFGVWFVFRGLNLAARKKISPDTHSVLARQNKETHE